MCGRTQLLVTWDQLVAMYRISPVPEAGGPTLPLESLPRWSVAPTQAVPGLRIADGKRALTPFRWGFPMMWLARSGKDPWARPLINAKAEDALQKRTWAVSIRRRRCVVPATGFYEWFKLGKRRLPVELARRDGDLLHLAGIWQAFVKDGKPVECVSILTTAASDDVTPVHHRMPVLLSGEPAIDRWLDPGTSDDDVVGLTQPAPAGTLRLRPMHTRLNHWSAAGPGLSEADWSLDAQGRPSLHP